jgi:hypothetical protein
MSAPYTRWATTLVVSGARTTTAASDALTMPDDIVGGSFFLYVSDHNSATTPTLDVAYRVTPDDGTTYLPVLRHAQVTTSPVYDAIHVSFCPWLQAGSTTTPALTGGALYANIAFTRKFTAYWTIGGTSPSFTFVLYFVGYRLAMAKGM